MDQTINDMLYGARIKSTVRQWNEQFDGKTPLTGGTIVASDGTTYKKVDGKLVQVIDPKMKKMLKRLENKLVSDGLVDSKTKSATELKTVENTSELVAEM